MKIILILSSLWLATSDTIVESDTVQLPKSVVLIKQNNFEIDRNQLRYQHQQGFFCDFEDNINKNRKLRLNIGVGDQ